jgi:hypothetical protein
MICMYIKSRLFLFGTTFRVFVSIFVAQKRIPSRVLFRGMVRNGNSESLFLFWFHGTEFRVVFSSAEGFGTELWEFASFFVPRNGIPSCFLFRGRVRNGIPRFSVQRNNRNSVGNNHLFRLFRLPYLRARLTSHNPLKVSLKCMRSESPLRNYGNPWTN